MLPTDPDLTPKRRRDEKIVIWIGMGVAIGAAIGVVTDNFALWIALGPAVGLGLGIALGARNRR